MTKTMDDLTQGYGDWIMRECWNGRIPYYINIMFHPLRGSSLSSIIPQIHHAIYDNFYQTLCKRFAKHPGRRCQEYLLPRVLLFLDLPVWKRGQITPSMREINQNLGLHVNGFILVLPKSHLNDDFNSHVARNQHLYVDRTVNGRSLYDKGGIERVHVKPVDFDPYSIADYSLKTVKGRKVDYDTTIILPRSWAEMHSNRPRLDPEAQAIKHIQAATNVSDELAMQIYNRVCQSEGVQAPRDF